MPPANACTRRPRTSKQQLCRVTLQTDAEGRPCWRDRLGLYAETNVHHAEPMRGDMTDSNGTPDSEVFSKLIVGASVLVSLTSAIGSNTTTLIGFGSVAIAALIAYAIYAIKSAYTPRKEKASVAATRVMEIRPSSSRTRARKRPATGISTRASLSRSRRRR